MCSLSQTLFVDLDGVICTEEPTFERPLAEAMPGARDALEALVAAGNQIVIYTSRSWAEFRVTEDWLRRNQIPYHGLHMGKPIADRWIDDRAIRFIDWVSTLEALDDHGQLPLGGPVDEDLLRRLRNATARVVDETVAREDVLSPILEVGPMVLTTAGDGGVFARMPETYRDTRRLLQDRGLEYISLDIDPSTSPDVIGDLVNADTLFGAGSFGTVLLLHCLEHIPQLWRVPGALRHLLCNGGQALIVTPWNIRFHGPRPDCWRISDDGYRALFEEGFEIERLEQLPTPGRPLSPLGIVCVVRRT
jgi:hypothetical protein